MELKAVTPLTVTLLFSSPTSICFVSAVCVLVSTFLLSCCMLFEFITSCGHNILTCCVRSKCHCCIHFFGCVVCCEFNCNARVEANSSCRACLSIALFGTMLYPPCAFCVCPIQSLWIFYQTLLWYLTEVFKAPDLDLSDLTSFLLTDLVHQISSTLHVTFSLNVFCEHSIY